MKKYIFGAIILVLLGWAVTVYAGTINKGQSAYLYQWYSTSPSKVMVDPNTGYITAVWYGSADVCAQLKSDLSVKFCHTVTVQ